MNQIQQPGRGQEPTAGDGQPRGQLFPTQHYLSEDVRAPIIAMLDRTLADTTVLMTHAKFAHWNVKGMEFYALHQLFDEIAEVFERHADEIAERITALGGQAMGTAGMAVSNATLPRMPTDAVTGKQYVEILADRLAIHDAALFEAINTAQSYGDPDTADLLNEVSREVTHYLWFLEAHLQTQPLPTAQPPGSAQPQPPGVGQQVPSQGTMGGQQSQGMTSGRQSQAIPSQGPTGGQQSAGPTGGQRSQGPTGGQRSQGTIGGQPPIQGPPQQF